jgi:hypothetical protein
MQGTIRAAIMALVRADAADFGASARRTAIIAFSAAVAALFAAAAIGCAVAALWIFAEPRIGPSGAALAAACCFLVLCLGVLGFAPIITRRHAPPRAPVASPELLLADLTRLCKDHKGPLLMAALVAGLLVGNESRER